VTVLTFGQRRDNLPAEVTRFIGPRRELPAIAEAVERYRLVTLRGVGGVGKTRLTLRAAADACDNFTDGCWLVQHGFAMPLTRREREIAGLVADGLGNREIAERLFLSKRRVDSHVEHIFTKLGFSARTQLVGWVLERKKPA